jgi:myo-inositol-1(or 4)-monophosphatase
MRARHALAAEIAREAGALQRRRFHETRVIETKSSAIDLVTDVDRACDALIRERITARFPDDGMLTEEDTEHTGTSGWRWIVDPLDGTTNYAHGFPHFAVSIGLEHAGRRGAGAFLGDQPIRVSATDDLRRALLGTGFAYDVHSAANDNLAYFEGFMKRAQAVRRAGSAALDLAYVACGRFDAFWELSLHPWDIAAGIVLVEEAGGRVSDFDAGPVPASGERIVGSNDRLHPAMLEVLAAVRA